MVKPKYGRPHRRVRAKFERLVGAGLAVCAYCRTPIAPDEEWDMGHDDADPSKYSGPEHRRCNRATVTRLREQVSQRTSRAW